MAAGGHRTCREMGQEMALGVQNPKPHLLAHFSILLHASVSPSEPQDPHLPMRLAVPVPALS